jgi:hypothetical protein
MNVRHSFTPPLSLSPPELPRGNLLRYSPQLGAKTETGDAPQPVGPLFHRSRALSFGPPLQADAKQSLAAQGPPNLSAIASLLARKKARSSSAKQLTQPDKGCTASFTLTVAGSAGNKPLSHYIDFGLLQGEPTGNFIPTSP